METERSPLAAGMFFERPRMGAPEFVKGKMSVKLADAIPMLQQYANEKGYVNFDLLESKDGSKLYLTVNTWKPSQASAPVAPPVRVPANPAYPTEEIRPEDIGF